MAANPSLPEDILLETFLRLPAKSVGKCKCLSKTWNTQLSTIHFINSHLKFHQQDEKCILVNMKSGSLHLLCLPSKNDEEPLTETIHPGSNNRRTRLLGSCNGLVLLQAETETKSMFVLNPITLQQVRVKIPADHLCSRSTDIYGFGYDPSSHDYKVVRFHFCYSSQVCARVGVYCLKTGVWRRVDNNKAPFDFDLRFVFPSGFIMPLVNGAVHCAVVDTHKMYNHLLAFELDNETFREVQLPTELKMSKMSYSLRVLKGCLSFVRNSWDLDIWMMKDYGVVDSWVRFHLDANVMGRPIFFPMCFVGDEELLCVDFYNRKCLLVWDLKDQGMVKTIGEGRIPFSVNCPSDCGVFVESLVSPEQGSQNDSDAY